MKKLHTTLRALMVTAALLVHLAPSASANESALDFRVVPAASSSLSEGGDYFVLAMEPGDVLKQALEISNPSKRPLQVRLAAVDAATAQMGGVDYGAEQITPEATGEWISLEQDTIRLGPDESREVSFDVAVPADAASGVHLGGVVVWVEGAEEETVAGAAATMNVQSRRVVAVQVELPGDAAPALEIRGAQAEARPDGLYLGIELFNSGSDFAKGTGTVSIEGRDAEESFLLDTVVPGTGTTYPFRWAEAGVERGSYDVTVEVDYGAGIATWEGEVTVGRGVQDDLRGRGVGSSDGPGQVLYLTVAGVLLLAVLAYLVRKGLLRDLPIPTLRVSRRPVKTRAAGALLPHPSVPSYASAPTVTRVPFVPRSEEEQRRVPPPPPPPPPGRPLTPYVKVGV